MGWKGSPGEDRGHHDSTCFPARTKISTPQGPCNIADLRRGDEVLSWQESGLTTEVVTALVPRPPSLVLALRFDGGMSLDVTAHHTLLTARGWIRVGKMKVGDEIRGVSGSTHKILSVTKVGIEPVFGLRTTGAHTFFADGCIAHNFTVLRRTRTLLHQLLVDWQYKQTPVNAVVRFG